MNAHPHATSLISSPVRHPRRPRYASRGQALIIAVLVMFLLVGLGGLFIAMVNNALIQTAQAADRDKLEGIARSAVELAKNELLYSPEGADWRPGDGPDAGNPGWFYSPDGGFYRTTVSYGPQSEDAKIATPLDRLVKISVEARYALRNMPDVRDGDASVLDAYQAGYHSPKRFLSRKVTAFMPIGLTDYLLWITDIDGTAQPAVLGTDLEVADPEDPSKPIRTVDYDPTNPQYNTDATLTDSTRVTPVKYPYLSVYNGPIRSEVDLKLGNVFLGLTDDDTATRKFSDIFKVKRHDLLEVAGGIDAFEGSSSDCRRVVVNEQDGGKAMTAVDGQTVFDPVAVARGGTNAQKMAVLPYVQSQQNNQLIRKQRAPRLDQRHPTTGLNRYRALTRDSGYWVMPSVGPRYNTGYVGMGEGLYIDNPEQIQYGGDLEALSKEWLNPRTSPQENPESCWRWRSNVTGVEVDADRQYVYRPAENGKAVELILFDRNENPSHPDPYIELHRYDGVKSFFDPSLGEWTDRIALPYPRNGVIFAEGNLTVRGNLPASLAFNADGTPLGPKALQQDTEQYAGGSVLDADGSVRKVQYYVNDVNRRYDLTIVSAGTIYIDGSLLGPATRQVRYATYDATNGWVTARNAGGLQPVPNRVKPGSAYDSKLALLAMDDVCLNPTQLFVRANRDAEADATDQYWRVQADPLKFTFTTAGPIYPWTRLLLRHAGDGINLTEPAYTKMQMRVNPDIAKAPKYQVYPWLGNNALAGTYDPTMLYFADTDRVADYFPGLPTDYTTGNLWGGPMFKDGTPFNWQSWPLVDPNRWDDAALFPGFTALHGYGALNTLQFERAENRDYLLSAGNDKYGPGLGMSGIDLQVDALIYAQRGSWFIIPGRYPNEDRTPDPDRDKWHDLPKYQEPADVRIVVNGAIAENRPASPEAVAEWTKHWRGANRFYYDTDTATPLDAFNRKRPTLWDPTVVGTLPGVAWSADAWSWIESLIWDPNPDPAVTGDESTLEFNPRRMGIEYRYDATLARPACYDVDAGDGTTRYYRPRLPKLPVSPNLFSVGKLSGR